MKAMNSGGFLDARHDNQTNEQIHLQVWVSEDCKREMWLDINKQA